MLKPAAMIDNLAGSGTPLEARSLPRIPVLALGMSLSLFIAVTYLLCVLFDLWFPTQAMHLVWIPLLTGFTWLTWPSLFLGLVEAFAYGWNIAMVFGPLYNYFAAKLG